MGPDIHELSQRLAVQAESVCAHYLSNGRRNGGYWQVGDVMNTPGKSLYVRLAGPPSGPGAAGKWTDAATGEYGDLVDLIRANRNLTEMRQVIDEILCFLSEPRVEAPRSMVRLPRGSAGAARRLFAAAVPIAGTLAEVYLRRREIIGASAYSSLRFHPDCYYRESDGVTRRLPALVAAVTDLAGAITGVQRTYLAADGRGKAAVSSPRKAMGDLLGHGVHLGAGRADVLAVGEGLETLLALRVVLPDLPMIAALSAGHLAALELPDTLRRLYIARDNDAAGARAAAGLGERASAQGIDVRVLTPDADDWNTALVRDGLDELRRQLAPVMRGD